MSTRVIDYAYDADSDSDIIDVFNDDKIDEEFIEDSSCQLPVWFTDNFNTVNWITSFSDLFSVY